MPPKPEADPTPQSHACEPRELSELMQTLPQELYATIYDLTFTAVPGMRFVSHSPPENSTVNYRDGARGDFSSLAEFSLVNGKNVRARGSKSRRWYRLFTKPNFVGLLHTDRESRRKFAASFFGGPKVYFVYDETRSMRVFASLVDPAHAGLIHDIRESCDEV